ncbi:MAG TPA: hypothetical protein VML75_18250 [Kofleriaceae bacterium]|nr:hypothetical protein [Kofleriaceae bacterium]
MRRRGVQYGSLTSLLDELFILLFASLARAAGVVHDSAAAATAEPAAPVAPDPALPPDAGAPAPVPEPSRVELRAEAIAELARGLELRQPVYVRISPEGAVIAIEVGTTPGTGDRQVGVPLLERVPDPDVGISYLGDRSADLRVCSIVMHHLGRADLRHDLVIIAPEVPLGELPVALVVGLQRDQERCARDAQGVAIVIDPLLAVPSP